MNSADYLSVLRQVWTAPGNASNRPGALLRAFRWFWRCHRHRNSPPELLPVFGSRLYPCYTDSIIAKHVMYRSEWFDYDLLQFMSDFLRPSDHYLDVGANTGLHALLASTRVTTGRITCVEPDPLNLSRLSYALELNQISNATVLPIAASDAPGRASLDGVDVFTRLAPTQRTTETAAREVRTARLDDVLGPQARVDLCKIDVEGAEWQVLRGLTGLMQQDALPVVVFELNASLHAYGHTEADFLDWLRAQGYHLASYRHDAKRLDFQGPFTDNDLFAFTQSGLDQVRERLPVAAIHG